MADLARLREPFPPEQIGKLPRVWCKDCRATRPAACGQNGHKIVKCEECRNKITSAHQHLEYVGHAEVTHRLLDVDPGWFWEPLAFDAEGLPAIKRDGKAVSLWIKLTVGGVTRLGVGIVEAGKDELDKQLISDALRNAAMRFGVALDLWAKSELDHTTSESGDTQRQTSDSGRGESSGPSAAPAAGEGAPSGAVESEPSPVTPSEDGHSGAPSARTPDPHPSSEPSDGGGAAGEVSSPAVSDDPEELLAKEETRKLIGRFNNLALQAKAEALGLKRSLGITDWFAADPDQLAKMRARVTELEQVPA